MGRLLLDMRADVTEVDFYCKVLKEIKKFELNRAGKSYLSEVVPKCYLGYYDQDVSNRETVGFVLALEDLVRQGFTMLDIDKGMNLQEAREVLGSIAVLHAVSHTFATVNSIDWTKDFPTLSNPLEYINHPVLKKLADRCLHSCLKTGDTDKDRRLMTFSANMQHDLAVKRSKGTHKCLVHADFYLSNLMRQPSSGKCKLIDFQFVTYGDPMFDVGLVLLFNSNIESVKDSFPELLRHYYTIFNDIVTSLAPDESVLAPWKSFDELINSFETEGYLSALRYSHLSMLVERFPGIRRRMNFIVEGCLEKNLI